MAAATGNMGYMEGLVMLQQHIAKSNQTMEAVRVDLREFLLKNKEAQMPRGGAILPGGRGGLPKQGAKLPGGSSVAIAQTIKPTGAAAGGAGGAAGATKSEEYDDDAISDDD